MNQSTPICKEHGIPKKLEQYEGGYTGWGCSKCTAEENSRIQFMIDSIKNSVTENK